MKNKIKIVVIIIVLLTGSSLVHSFSVKEVSFYPEKIKISLRAVGHKLLLLNNDTTSLVLPIKEIDDHTFELSFEKEITINPEVLVKYIDTELKKVDSPENYITELINCKTNEVSYSYEILGSLIENEISCLGRNLPKSCYTIKVIILKENIPSLYSAMGNTYILSLGILLIILLTGTSIIKKKSKDNILETVSDHINLGTLVFYPNQQKLIKDHNEISLTAKENELLSIFVKYPNQIIKRELLTKQVWEDNGIIVGRSLDMFISKIRKKLGKDSNVKIANIHGVGYRLEITSRD